MKSGFLYLILCCLVHYSSGDDYSIRRILKRSPTTVSCPGAPVCEAAPSSDCTTSHQYRTIDGKRCRWGCKHWCCSTVEALQKTCPTTSPSNPYCIATNIVYYTINGKRCPVYCGCIPDCRVLTC